MTSSLQSRVADSAVLLSRMAELIEARPFRPHRLFTTGHAQTLAAYAWPRRHRLRVRPDEERLFEVAPGIRVLAHCRWQPERAKHPTIIIWHGIEGSTGSVYMRAMAKKGFAAGFNIVRVNLRNCGGTEHLTPTLYHGGLTEDLRTLVSELIEKDQLDNLMLVGFSLGGNMVLKLGGEYGNNPPPQVKVLVAVSPSVDLGASAEVIALRSNWLYHRDFLRRLRNRIRLKHQLFPDLYDISGLDQVRTIRDFDDRYTALAHGFASADDYYYRASSIRVIDRIRIPTLIIHAEDDPFIPFAPLRHPSIAENPNILLVAPKQGGHVAFIQSNTSLTIRSESNTKEPLLGQPNDDSRFYDSRPEDRFWAENRVIDFCKLARISDTLLANGS